MCQRSTTRPQNRTYSRMPPMGLQYSDKSRIRRQPLNKNMYMYTNFKNDNERPKYIKEIIIKNHTRLKKDQRLLTWDSRNFAKMRRGLTCFSYIIPPLYIQQMQKKINTRRTRSSENNIIVVRQQSLFTEFSKLDYICQNFNLQQANMLLVALLQSSLLDHQHVLWMSMEFFGQLRIHYLFRIGCIFTS